MSSIDDVKQRYAAAAEEARRASRALSEATEQAWKDVLAQEVAGRDLRWPSGHGHVSMALDPDAHQLAIYYSRNSHGLVLHDVARLTPAQAKDLHVYLTSLLATIDEFVGI